MLAEARTAQLAALERALQYRFQQVELLNQALTHKSYVHEQREPVQHNERLEFLGDAVLGLVISDYSYGRFPDLAEGELSKLRASLVNEGNLARIARRLELGTYLLVGRGEELTGGRAKASLLADTLEAVLAAIYLDSSLEDVYQVVLQCFQEDLATVLHEGHKDYKSELQEYTQEKFGCIPTYIVVRERGPDHEKVFEVKLAIRGHLQGFGAGKSKKEAEQEAARKVLKAFSEVELLTDTIVDPLSCPDRDLERLPPHNRLSKCRGPQAVRWKFWERKTTSSDGGYAHPGGDCRAADTRRGGCRSARGGTGGGGGRRTGSRDSHTPAGFFAFPERTVDQNAARIAAEGLTAC